MKRLLTLLLLFAGAVQAQVVPNLPSGTTTYWNQTFRVVNGTDTTYWTGKPGAYVKIIGYQEVRDSLALKADKTSITGTPGYLAEFGSSTLVNSPIFADTGNVGIGTTAPGRQFVVGNGTTQGEVWIGAHVPGDGTEPSFPTTGTAGAIVVRNPTTGNYISMSEYEYGQTINFRSDLPHGTRGLEIHSDYGTEASPNFHAVATFVGQVSENSFQVRNTGDSNGIVMRWLDSTGVFDITTEQPSDILLDPKGNMRVMAHMIPEQNDMWNIGSDSLKWRNIYASDTVRAAKYLGDSDSTAFSASSAWVRYNGDKLIQSFPGSGLPGVLEVTNPVTDDWLAISQGEFGHILDFRNPSGQLTIWGGELASRGPIAAFRANLFENNEFSVRDQADSSGVVIRYPNSGGIPSILTEAVDGVKPGLIIDPLGILTLNRDSLTQMGETHIGYDNTTGKYISFTGNGAGTLGTFIRMRNAGGTLSSPTNTPAGNTLSVLAAQAYSGSTWLSMGELDFGTDPTPYTPGFRPGSFIDLYTNPVDGDQVKVVRFGSDGKTTYNFDVSAPTFTTTTQSRNTSSTLVATTEYADGAGNIVNLTTSALSNATLSSTYPSVAIGYRVICPDITGAPAIYTKAKEAGATDVWLTTDTTLTP